MLKKFTCARFATICLSVLVFATANTACAQSNCFAPFADFRYTYGPNYGTHIAAADMNNDNKGDVIIAAGDIYILNGNNNGSFGAGAFYTANGQTTSAIAIADFNSDNKPDIISLDNPNGGYKSLSIYTNTNYTGVAQALTLPTTISANGAQSPGCIKATDLDGDNKKDIVINDYDGNKLYVYKNNGNNTLTLLDSVITAGKPLNIALADINNDNRPDIACSYYNTTDTVSVYLNTGTGLFGTGNHIAGGIGYGGILLSDVDGDNKPDLVSSYSSSVRFRKGNGNGTFAVGYTDAYIAAVAKDLIAGDFNNDGAKDIAFVNSFGHTAGVVTGNGNGTFNTPVNFSTYGQGANVVMADFDTDSKVDMITVNGTEKTISFLKGQADGSFGPLSLQAGGGAERFAIGRINGDTIADIITADYRANTVTVMLGNSDGSFQPSIHDTCGGAAHDVALGRFDGDALTDAVVANNGNLALLTGNGNGSFKTPVYLPVVGTGGDWAVAAGDLNNDTYTDIVASCANVDSIFVLLGNGNGTFQATKGYATGQRPYDVKLAHLNGDNYLDIVVPNDGTNDVWVFINSGTGTFTNAVSNAVGASPRTAATADLDNDGDIDIASANNNADNVSVLLNNGSGTFTAAVNYPVSTSGSISTVATGMFNADVYPDLIIAQPGLHNVAILLNNGDGTFGSLSTYVTDYSPTDALLFDFNYDGFTDIASANNVGSVTVILNSGITLSAAGSTQLCTGDSVRLTATGGTSYLWSTGATTASIYASASGTYTATVTVATSSGNCLAEPGSIPVTVASGPPAVTLATSNRYCISDGQLNLSMVGGSPQGGTYSGNNISNGIFNITAAGAGQHIISYSISNNCGTNSASDTIFVDTETLASINLPQDTFCDSQGQIVLAPYGTPAGGKWGVNNTVVTTVNPSVAGVGSYLLHYAIVAGGCRDTAYLNAVVENCTGIAAIENSGISIYPNPNNGTFILGIENDQKFDLAELIDITGRIVYRQNTGNQNRIQVNANLSNGMYLLRLSSAHVTHTKKIIIE
ncbi:MAG: T9SS type A sorting domain-containing protein [Chitinophagales bacterium]|nr:T9SS type A sorting domain-containing protein [Chitinophagales bacterium]